MLRAGRLERGLTQEQLGARIGQPAAEISAYESGQSVPNPKVMAALLAELKLPSAVTDVHYVPKHSADPGTHDAHRRRGGARSSPGPGTVRGGAGRGAERFGANRSQ